VKKKIAAIVEKVTGVPSAVTLKIADGISKSGVLEPKNLQQQVKAARTIGKIAVQFGSQKLATKLQDLSNLPIVPVAMHHFVRQALASDIEELRRFETEARSQLEKFRGGARLAAELPEVGSLWGERIDSPRWTVFVAGLDGVPMGYLCIDFEAQRDAPLIEAVYVTADARELGIGDAMVSAAIEECLRHGADAIDAYALPGDRETKNLFERSGLTARLLIVTKKIGE